MLHSYVWALHVPHLALADDPKRRTAVKFRCQGRTED